MTKKKLKAALKDCERVRDAWCAEYVTLRDRLAGAGVAAPSTENSSSVTLPRPCILFTVILLVMGESITATQACHRFSRWLYPWPQRCVSASLQRVSALTQLPPERIRDEPKQSEIPLPDLGDIVWGEIGPEELRAIALLRELYNAR